MTAQSFRLPPPPAHASSFFTDDLDELREFVGRSDGEHSRVVHGVGRLAFERHVLIGKNVGLGWGRVALGSALAGLKRYAEAEPLLLSGYEGMKEREAEIRPDVRATRLKGAIERLVQLYEETKQPEKAAQWRQKLAEFDSGRGEERPVEGQEKSPTSAAENRKVP